jgi:hypothetical protein
MKTLQRCTPEGGCSTPSPRPTPLFRQAAAAVFAAVLGIAGARGESPVTVEARKILANTRETTYRHKTFVDLSAGRYEFDCTGLSAFILPRVDTAAFHAVELADRPDHPRARAYYDIFAAAPTNAASSSNGWVRVARVADLLPGDFVAWRKTELTEGKSSGHIVIVDSVPEAEDDGSWRVAIIDATTKPHAQDTRPAGTGGVGRGILWITVGDDGGPLGIRPRSLKDTPRTSMPISMGRLAGVRADFDDSRE